MIADLVYESTNTSGTGDFALAGARSADFRTFSAAHTIGERVFYCCRGGGQWEVGEGTLVGVTTLERTTVFNGSAGAGVKVNFAAGSKEIYETLNSGSMVDMHTLAAVESLLDNDRVLVLAADGTLRTLAGSILKASGTGGGTVDTVAPSAPTALSSSGVTTTGFSINFTAGTDNVGVQRHEWSLDGTTWTQITSGTSFTVTGRTANTTYTVRVRAVDTSGNVSTAATLNVTTAAASGDTTAPTMSGSITTSSITASGYTFAWPAGSDNVAVDHYETSIDGGSAWTNSGTALSRTVTGRPASTTDNLRVRAHDAAGNMSNVLTGSVTTLAAGATMAATYTVSDPPSGYATVPATDSFEGGTAPNQYFTAPTYLSVKAADNTYPAEGAMVFFWIRVASGAAAPTTLPAAMQHNGSSWPASVPYSANGGTGTGNVPNSVKTANYSNQASYPGTFMPSSTLYGGGAAGDYYVVVGFSDGSYTIHSRKAAVS